MTTGAQDFTTYAGDSALILFTVDDSTGAPLDISAIAEITWTAQRDLASAVVLSKTMTGGNIRFVTDGTNGQFQLTLLGTDTSALSGFYMHEALLTDGDGNTSTVTLGRMNVGRAPVWTYSGDPTSSAKDAVRFLVGDTLSGDPQIQDGEILYTLQVRGTTLGAAAQCCRSLATQFSRKADTIQGDMRVTYSTLAKNYSARAAEYEQRDALTNGGQSMYVGGISYADKRQQVQNCDRVKPQFNLGMDDNYLPIAPAGNQGSGRGE